MGPYPRAIVHGFRTLQRTIEIEGFLLTGAVSILKATAHLREKTGQLEKFFARHMPSFHWVP